MRRVDHKDVLKAWRRFLETERDVSYSTSARYYRHVSNWLVHLGRKRKHFTDATREDCSEYWGSIKRLKSSSTSVQFLCALRQFYDWAYERDWYDGVNYWNKFARPKVTHATRPVISVDEMHALIEKRPPEVGWKEIRNRAMIVFLYGTGLRVSEAASVKLADLDLASKVVHCIGKGKKPAKQPIPEAIIPVLEEWLEARALRVNRCDRLFINRSGHPLSAQGIRMALQSYVREIGMPYLPINPHVLRKSACTHLYENNHDIYAVQKFARHSRPDTTQRYVGTAASAVKETVEIYHPLSKWYRDQLKQELECHV